MDAEIKFFIKCIVGVVVVIATVVTLFLGVYKVNTGTRALVFSGGKLTAVAEEGLHLKIPYYQTTQTVLITTQSIDEVKAEAASSDLQVVDAAITLNYHFNKDKLPEIYSQTQMVVEDNIIRPRIQETLKAVIAKYTAENLIVNRALAKREIDDILKQDLGRYNIIVEDVQLTNFQFSKEFNKAIEAKQTEAQNALKAKNTLERIKIEAEQRVTQAKAEADAIRIQAEAVKVQGGAEYVQLKWIEKWDGKTPTTVTGQNTGLLLMQK